MRKNSQWKEKNEKRNMPDPMKIKIFNQIQNKQQKTENQKHINVFDFQWNKVLQKNPKNKTNTEDK